MALLEIDRKLLERCLEQKPNAWEDFVDRFLGLVVHVVRHSAHARSTQLTAEDEEDLAAEFFVELLRNDMAILRRFRGQSSLATYLTVVARRVIVRELLGRQAASRRIVTANPDLAVAADTRFEERIGDRDLVERLIGSLSLQEAEVVRLYHLEGRSYREISAAVGVPENSIGPTLSRARAKMREVVADHSV